MNEENNFESIYLLKKAEKLDPANFAYPYEIGIAYYLQDDYKKAVKYLKKATQKDSCQAQCFLYLAKIQKQNNEVNHSIETYKVGIEKLKNAGELYFQLGIAFQESNDIGSAIVTWKKGTIQAPNYASNYYATSLYFCKHTTDRLTGVIDGELFMNFERESEQTVEISQLLYATYKQSIIYNGKYSTINLTSKKRQAITTNPFPTLFKHTMDSILQKENSNEGFSIQSLHKLRTAFIVDWYQSNDNQQSTTVLFDWHKKLIARNHFESYNYWLFRKANEKEFNEWYYYNKNKFDEFIEWFSLNPLIID